MTTPVAEDRTSRKRTRTRAQLIEAAVDAFARNGIDATTIAEITGGADVALGTFYNYFPSKDEIAQAAIEHLIAQISAELREAAAAHPNQPAHAIAAIVRRVFEWHDRNPVWGKFLLEVGLQQEDLAREFGLLLYRVIDEGIEAQVFRPAHATLAPISLAGVVVAGLGFRHAGIVGADAVAGFASHALRLLGVEAAEADEIASRPRA